MEGTEKCHLTSCKAACVHKKTAKRALHVRFTVTGKVCACQAVILHFVTSNEIVKTLVSADKE